MKKYLAGLNVPPAIVAGLRGLVLAFVGGVISLVLSYLTGDTVPKEWAAYIPIAIFVLRQVEGLIDQKRDPNQNRMPPLADVRPSEAAAIVSKVHEENKNA